MNSFPPKGSRYSPFDKIQSQRKFTSIVNLNLDHAAMTQIFFKFSLLDCDDEQQNQWSVLQIRTNTYGFTNLFCYRILLLNGHYHDWEKVKGKWAELSWVTDNKKQMVRGLITRFSIAKPSNNQFLYGVHLRSPLFTLSLNQQNRIFIHKSPKEIIELILKKYPTISHQIICTHNEKIKLLIQYNQTDLQLLQHLLIKRLLQTKFLKLFSKKRVSCFKK